MGAERATYLMSRPTQAADEQRLEPIRRNSKYARAEGLRSRRGAAHSVLSRSRDYEGQCRTTTDARVSDAGNRAARVKGRGREARVARMARVERDYTLGGVILVIVGAEPPQLEPEGDRTSSAPQKG